MKLQYQYSNNAGEIKMSSWIEQWVKEGAKQREKEEQRLSKICKKRKIAEVLERHGSSHEGLKTILQLLIMSGVGDKKAWKVVQNPKLLSQYLQMAADGASPLEIAAKLFSW